MIVKIAKKEDMITTDLTIGKDLVMKKTIQKIDHEDAKYFFGNIELSKITSSFELAQITDAQSFANIMLKIGEITSGFQNLIYLAITGHEDYIKLKKIMNNLLDKFYEIHDFAYDQAIEINKKEKETSGKLN